MEIEVITPGQIGLSAVSLALVDRINAGHATLETMIEASKQAFIDQVNKAREVGLYLKELRDEEKKKGGKRHWTGMFATAFGKRNITSVLCFDYITGCRYIKLGEALPNPVETVPEAWSSLKDVMLAFGILSPGKRSNQEAHEVTVFAFLTAESNRFDAQWKKLQSRNFFEQVRGMSPEEKAQVEDQIKPMWEKINELMRIVSL
jgi:hypothetical protein